MLRSHLTLGLFVLVLPGLAAAQETKWFHEGIDAALTAAGSAPSGMVLLYCWQEGNDECKAFYEGIEKDPGVVAAMADFVNVSANKAQPAGEAMLARFAITRVPTVLFVKPDGSVEDVLSGVLSPVEFAAEVQRVRSGKDTIGSLRAAAAAKPNDLALQVALGRKLRASGDAAGAEKIFDAVVQKDPKGTAEPAAEVLFLRICDRTFRPEIAPQDVDLKELKEFLIKVKSKRIQFLGHDRIMAAEWRREDLKAATQACIQAWKNIPPDEVMDWGNRVVARAYEFRKDLDKAQERLMLDIARKSIAEAEKAAKTRSDGKQFLAERLYTFAAAQYVNNQRKEAFAAMERAIELDPKNENLVKALEAWKSGAK